MVAKFSFILEWIALFSHHFIYILFNKVIWTLLLRPLLLLRSGSDSLRNGDLKKKKVDHVVTRRRKLATSFGLSSSRQTGRVEHHLSTTTLWEGLPSTHVVEGAGAPTSPIMRGRGWPTHVTDRRSKRTTSDRRTARASSRVLLNLANG